ncbi:hypothetical protein D3C81_1846130 [compost metagenome]
MSMPARTTSLICASASGGMPAMPRASSSALGRVWASATTSLTSPIASASSALTMQPVSSMRSAWYLPTARSRRWVPPAPGITPTLISGWAKRAEAPATIRSQCIASSQPPPRA